MLNDSFTPKLLTVIREGYSWAALRRDISAGLTVAVVALPLSMALAIASGTTPEKGLVTAVIAGFLISAFGGSRTQIGGPTGAFVVVVFNVIAQHGYDGLLLATFMAGLILVGAGLLRFGRYVKFIPHPVVTGFTAGIAVIIATSQIADFLGLSIASPPTDFLARWQTYLYAMDTADVFSLSLGFGALATIVVLRRYAPGAPGFLIAMVIAATVVAALHLPVDTIGTRFPDVDVSLPSLDMPDFSWQRCLDLLPSALTIAFLAGIEALLSAVVADGMAGTRHRSNQELIGQGIANLASAAFGGLPATGAIARTATNIRSGGRTPVAGMSHALFLLLFVLVGAQLMQFVPMPALAAILLMVAWGMCEHERFALLLRMPAGDRTVLLTTFLLTLLADLTVAIAVGVTLASLIFMARMAESAGFDNSTSRDAELDEEDVKQRQHLPEGVEVFRLTGPFFFGVAGQLLETLRSLGHTPRVIIVRMRLVPLLDASGGQGLVEFVTQARQAGVEVVLSGVQAQPMSILNRLDCGSGSSQVHHAKDFEYAQALAEQLTQTIAQQRRVEE